MTVKEIVEAYLKANGYDGLYSGECGCRIDDLMPCDWTCIPACKPGYTAPCNPEICPADGDCDWHIGPRNTVSEC